MYDDNPFQKEREKIKAWWIVFAVLVLILASLAQNIYWRSISYTGRVVSKYSKVVKGRRSTSRTYYIKVETNKGKTYEVPVPYYIYSKIRVGAWVKKKKGERYPKVVVGP